VPAGGATVLFSHKASTHLLTITVGGDDASPTPAESSTPTTSPAATTVAPSTGGTSDAGLPATGNSTVLPLTISGAAIVGVGAFLLVVARRRRDNAG
jgi:LPXTG-motif cell wall-anchored protein